MLERLTAKVLASRVIASADPVLLAMLGVSGRYNSLALFTTDCDDVGYTAADEATKKAAVGVVRASSFYAGAAHASGPFSGEFIAVLGADSPADAEAGLQAAIEHIASGPAFYKLTGGNPAFFAHTIPACGSYFAEEDGVPIGSALAYLIAPPLEATFALDAALKAANVTLTSYFPPPSETNFSGARLSGSQAACEAACEAFKQAVLAVSRQPHAAC